LGSNDEVSRLDYRPLTRASVSNFHELHPVTPPRIISAAVGIPADRI